MQSASCPYENVPVPQSWVGIGIGPIPSLKKKHIVADFIRSICSIPSGDYIGISLFARVGANRALSSARPVPKLEDMLGVGTWA